MHIAPMNTIFELDEDTPQTVSLKYDQFIPIGILPEKKPTSNKKQLLMNDLQAFFQRTQRLKQLYTTYLECTHLYTLQESHLTVNAELIKLLNENMMLGLQLLQKSKHISLEKQILLKTQLRETQLYIKKLETNIASLANTPREQ